MPARRAPAARAELRLIDARGDAAQLLQRLDEQLQTSPPARRRCCRSARAHRAWRGYRAGGRGRAHPAPMTGCSSSMPAMRSASCRAGGGGDRLRRAGVPRHAWLRGPKGLGVLYLGERALERLALPDGLDVGGAQWSDAFASGTG
ncbi:hypothetical protein ACPA9J_09980 [Pseudomonas aeruginosa]